MKADKCVFRHASSDICVLCRWHGSQPSSDKIADIACVSSPQSGSAKPCCCHALGVRATAWDACVLNEVDGIASLHTERVASVKTGATLKPGNGQMRMSGLSRKEVCATGTHPGVLCEDLAVIVNHTSPAVKLDILQHLHTWQCRHRACSQMVHVQRIKERVQESCKQGWSVSIYKLPACIRRMHWSHNTSHVTANSLPCCRTPTHASKSDGVPDLRLFQGLKVDCLHHAVSLSL